MRLPIARLRSPLAWLSKHADKATQAKRPFAQVHDVRVERVEMPDMEKNVLSRPLALHSTSPLTGFLRNGYCTAPASDAGNHSVAGIVSEEFLDFSAARGNDLRVAGLTGGCKWCLCVSRWREAFDARGKEGDGVVPRVVLEATSVRALEKVSVEELRGFAVDADGKK